jgi:hypothetical protein
MGEEKLKLGFGRKENTERLAKHKPCTNSLLLPQIAIQSLMCD